MSATDPSAFVAWASTNIVNLGTHPLGALVGSALIVNGSLLDAGTVITLWLGIAGALWSVEARHGTVPAAAVFLGGHVGGTLLTVPVILPGIRAGRYPEEDPDRGRRRDQLRGPGRARRRRRGPADVDPCALGGVRVRVAAARRRVVRPAPRLHHGRPPGRGDDRVRPRRDAARDATTDFVIWPCATAGPSPAVGGRVHLAATCRRDDRAVDPDDLLSDTPIDQLSVDTDDADDDDPVLRRPGRRARSTPGARATRTTSGCPAPSTSSSQAAAADRAAQAADWVKDDRPADRHPVRGPRRRRQGRHDQAVHRAPQPARGPRRGAGEAHRARAHPVVLPALHRPPARGRRDRAVRPQLVQPRRRRAGHGLRRAAASTWSSCARPPSSSGCSCAAAST